MYNSGFVIMYRDEVEDWLWQDPQLYHWWIFLRMKAALRPSLQTVGEPESGFGSIMENTQRPYRIYLVYGMWMSAQ